MSSNPILSIAIVTYNAGEFLQKTLDSIFQQTFTDYELIIIDGKSTDNTLEIIKKYQDRITYWVSEKDKGIYHAMNKSLVAANGDYVQFLNAGDYYTGPDVLDSVFSQVNGQPTLIYGDINIVQIDGIKSYQKAKDFTLEQLLGGGTGVICHQAMLVKRKKAPLYNTNYRFKAELNWYFDLLEVEGFTYQYCEVPIVDYSLGGYGHQNFLKNRLEWIKVIYNRFGISTVFESKILLFLYQNSLHRYPFLNTVHAKAASFFKMLDNFSLKKKNSQIRELQQIIDHLKEQEYKSKWYKNQLNEKRQQLKSMHFRLKEQSRASQDRNDQLKELQCTINQYEVQLKEYEGQLKKQTQMIEDLRELENSIDAMRHYGTVVKHPLKKIKAYKEVLKIHGQIKQNNKP